MRPTNKKLITKYLKTLRSVDFYDNKLMQRFVTEPTYEIENTI